MDKAAQAQGSAPDVELTEEQVQEVVDQLVATAMAEIDRLKDDASAGPAETVVELSRLPKFRPAGAMLAMAFVEGLLAIHQSGAHLVLAHPFRIEDEDAGEGALIWHELEPVPCSKRWRPFAKFRNRFQRTLARPAKTS